MQIPSYQIQNVLKVYSKQLSQQKLLAKSSAVRGQSSADNVTLSSKGKRQAIIEKVAANIVSRITTEGPKEQTEEKIASEIKKELDKKIDFTHKDKNKFTYTYIDEHSKKITSTFSVEDSEFIVKRLTELAKQVADDNMES